MTTTKRRTNLRKIYGLEAKENEINPISFHAKDLAEPTEYDEKWRAVEHAAGAMMEWGEWIQVLEHALRESHQMYHRAQIMLNDARYLLDC